MGTKELMEYSFEFVEEIVPNKNRDGTIHEYYPELSYNNKENAVLHKYGEGPFCRFCIHPKWCISGVYALFIDRELVYVGQALDLAKRWNTGYGNISARACWSNGNSGGQSTNCKINKVVFNASKECKSIKLYFYKTADYHIVEKALIENFHPIYNISMNKNPLVEKPIRTYLPKIQETDLNRNNLGTEEIREYIRNILKTAKEKGNKEVVLVSGDIHKDLNLKNCMPSVCNAMYSAIRTNYEVLLTTKSGKSSTIKIKYYL